MTKRFITLSFIGKAGEFNQIAKDSMQDLIQMGWQDITISDLDITNPKSRLYKDCVPEDLRKQMQKEEQNV